MLYNLNETEKLTPLQAFSDYLSLKLHFNGDMLWRPAGLINRKITKATLYNRPDAKWFYQACRDYPKRVDYVNVLVTGFLANPKAWIGDCLHQDADSDTAKREGKIYAIIHNLQRDVDDIYEYMQDNEMGIIDILRSNTGVPAIHSKRTKMGNPCLETLCALDYAFQFTQYTKDLDPLWSVKSVSVDRYKYFCLSKSETNTYLDIFKKLLGR